MHLVSQLSGGAALCAVVKADGYGHGADACAAAALEGGASRLAVATAREAEQIGRRFQHVPLLTMGALTAAEVDVALAAGSEVAVGREDFLHIVAERARAQGRPAKVHVKHDSGMGRLGTADPEEVMALIRICEQDADLRPAGLWTHFATADEPDSDFFEEQLRRFAPLASELKASHPEIIVHAANSAALFRDPAAHFDMARCGIAI
jgi:alanine racemase